MCLFLKFSIHLQAIMYHFEQRDHDIHQGFLFQILEILFDHVYNLHQ